MKRKEFRMKKGESVWHCSSRCEEWPREEYDSLRSGRMPTGSLCLYCNIEHFLEAREGERFLQSGAHPHIDPAQRTVREL